MTTEQPFGILYDKRGIPIERGDIIKVVHFVGARQKRQYMYTQCLGFRNIGPNGDTPYLEFSQLNFIECPRRKGGPYLERPDGRCIGAYEIVQGLDGDFTKRPRENP